MTSPPAPAATRKRGRVRLAGAATAEPGAAELADVGSESYSSTISRSWSARSFTDCTRWSGALARQRRMMRLSSTGTFGFSSSTATGFSLRIRCIVSTPVAASNGRRRVAAS